MTHAAMTGTASHVQPGDWAADPAACSLTFAVRNFGLGTVTATGRLDRRSAGVTAPAFLVGHLVRLSLAIRLRPPQTTVATAPGVRDPELTTRSDPKEPGLHTHTDYPPSRPGHAEDGQGQAGFGTATAGMVGRFGALPFRQLAGPAAVLFWWPPRPGRTASAAAGRGGTPR